MGDFIAGVIRELPEPFSFLSCTRLLSTYLMAKLPKSEGGQGFRGSLQQFLTRAIEEQRFAELWASLLAIVDGHTPDSEPRQ